MDERLGYDKHKPSEPNNTRNGKSTKRPTDTQSRKRSFYSGDLTLSFIVSSILARKAKR